MSWFSELKKVVENDEKAKSFKDIPTLRIIRYIITLVVEAILAVLLAKYIVSLIAVKATIKICLSGVVEVLLVYCTIADIVNFIKLGYKTWRLKK